MTRIGSSGAGGGEGGGERDSSFGMVFSIRVFGWFRRGNEDTIPIKKEQVNQLIESVLTSSYLYDAIHL